MLKSPGECEFSSSDFCHDGYDAMCPLGFSVYSDTTLRGYKAIEDCY